MGPNSSNIYGLTFHHLGLAVNSPETAAGFLKGLGYQIGTIIFDPLQNVNLALCEHAAMPAVEIIYPTSNKGPLDRLLMQHKDGIVYHMCYTSQDVDASIDAMEADNMRVFCVSAPKKAILFEGKMVSFYLVANVGLIEIIESSH